MPDILAPKRSLNLVFSPLVLKIFAATVAVESWQPQLFAFLDDSVRIAVFALFLNGIVSLC